MKIFELVLSSLAFVMVSSQDIAVCPLLDLTCYKCIINEKINGCSICECSKEEIMDEIEWGDLLLTSVQAKMLQEKDFNYSIAEARGGSTDLILKWDNVRTSDGMYRVPFYFDNDPELDADAQDNVQRAISAYNAQTCIRFEPAKVGDESIIRFKKGFRCSSFVGRKTGIRTIRGCTDSVGEVIKALMHALGFWSETTRRDRDDYVILIPENMNPDKIRLTLKLRPDLWYNYSFPYDYSSITHFPPLAFSAFGGPTVFNRMTGKVYERNKWALSSGDLRQLRAMYNCSGIRGTTRSNNCYRSIDRGLTYRGNVNVTESGYGCQRWDSQSPQDHKMLPTILTGSKLKDNYCRNPDMKDRPWCFTTNSSVRWEYCNISLCNDSDLPLALPTELTSVRGFWGEWSEYSGCSTTCGSGYKYTTRFCVGSRVRGEDCPGDYWNYTACSYPACPGSDEWFSWETWSECDVECGNGTRTRVRFCIGTVGRGSCVGEAVETEDCETGISCPLYEGGECYNASDLQSYRGTVNVNAKGATCLNWTDSKLNVSAYPNAGLEENYCRNPDGKKKVPYCFQTKNTKVTRTNCNITECNYVATWGQWSAWSGCSSTCGNGTMTATRLCTGGGYGEGSCLGSVLKTKSCNTTCDDGSIIDVVRKPRTTTPMPTTTPSVIECIDYENPRSYRGTRRWSKSGLNCQEWDAAYPWMHNYTDPTLIAEAGLSENFCRTPNPGDKRPWCFVVAYYPKKEDCDIPVCPYTDDLLSYFFRLWANFLEKLGISGES